MTYHDMVYFPNNRSCMASGLPSACVWGEGSEEDEDFAHFGVIDEAPKPAFQPLKERPQEMGSRWKKAEVPRRREMPGSVILGFIQTG